MVSGSLVFRVSGKERTSKPERRHKLIIMKIIILIIIII